MDTSPKFLTDARINWYRCKVDRAVMSELMQTSDLQGCLHALGHLGMWLCTGTLAYLAFLQVHAANWYWSVPLLLAALFAHATVGSFMGGTACHELSHKTPFKTKALNEFFLKIFAFLAYWDHVWFRPSHIKHHQVTVHKDYDGEVILPQKLTLKDWRFWLGQFAYDPKYTWDTWKMFYRHARGEVTGDWYQYVLPEENEALRREHRNWARFVLIGHAVLAAVFILTGHWFLIVLVTLGTRGCYWLQTLVGAPQHFGLSSNVPDHRLCCRTFTCSWLPGFLYWNMQYHIEHHMFPAVPFFNLPRLHNLIEYDLPPTPHGLRSLWKHMLEVNRKQVEDPAYVYVPPLPNASGGRAGAAYPAKEL